MRCEVLGAWLMLLGGCAPEASRGSAAFQPAVLVPEPEACATDAEKLEEAAVVRAGPSADSPSVDTLPAGRFILRCAVRSDWQFVRYPDAGAAVDCTARSCTGGWIEKTVLTRRYD